jgi:TonB family protein
VSVAVTIDEEGNVVAARATQGPPELHNAATAAARAWKFSPARQGGRPVRATRTLIFNFALL